MKYFEEHFIEDIRAYLQGTYGQHYSIDAIQLIDIWEAKGSLESTSIDVAQKYLFRYGKKDGFNRKDLLKAIHYIIIAMYARDKKEGKLPNETRTGSELKK